jgi:hypothetical protein
MSAAADACTTAQVLLAAGTRFLVANTVTTGELTVVNLKVCDSWFLFLAYPVTANPL